MADYQLPSNLIFSDLTLTQEIPSFTNESLNMKVRSKSRGLHRLSGTMDVTIEDLIDQRAYLSFLAKCKGRASSFELDLPLHFKSEVGSNPTTTSSVSIGSTQFNLSYFTGTIHEGTFFNMPNDDKTYVATNTISGGGTLTFFPAMRQSHFSGSRVEVMNPVITVRFQEDNQRVDFIEQGKIVTTSLEWQEAL